MYILKKNLTKKKNLIMLRCATLCLFVMFIFIIIIAIYINGNKKQRRKHDINSLFMHLVLFRYLFIF